MPLKRGRSENDVIVLPTEENGALDKFGVFTFSTDLDTVAFVKDLRECSALWFNENLEKMLADPPKSMFFSEKNQTKYEDVVKGKAKWDSLSPEEQKSIKAKFDLHLDSGMQWVFVTGSLEKEPWFEALECKDFLKKAISFVRMGNVAMGLANMAQAWTAKGFGLWAHLIPDFGLRMVEDTMQRMIDLGFEVGKPQHFPHPIYKPPDGAALEVHHDQMAPSALLRHLKEHVDSEDPSTTAWVKRHGIQLLAHLTGGTGTENGATFIIGPMTPKKLLICLSFYAEGGAGAGSGYKEWLANRAARSTCRGWTTSRCSTSSCQRRARRPSAVCPRRPRTVRLVTAALCSAGPWAGHTARSRMRLPKTQNRARGAASR